MKAKPAWLSALVVVGITLLVAGCPGVGEPSVLEGDWQTTLDDGILVTFTFNSDGELTQIAGERDDGATAMLTVTGSSSEVDGSDVTVTVPFDNRTATYNATLSDDQNTMTGTLTAEVDFGDDLVVTLPQGELTVERVVEDD